MREFEKYYPGPYRFDYSCGWVIGTPGDDTYIHCFDWETSSFTDEFEPTEIQKLWLKKINGETVFIPGEYSFKVSDDDPVLIECNGEPIICVRGWGMLCGSNKLPMEEAARIQDEFINYIIKRLSN
jgi:hypothetical protein